ncbi:unnamed protein product [Sphenostylis stenocarpa]|uniref:Uncharacterized protein n=1 Tax=Sphenostylis stenocarpa TaxID=92480 RepID=A0AA86SXA1_9FABA|nr:unnamed protein product [Sphenostylis stenocarpa]
MMLLRLDTMQVGQCSWLAMTHKSATMFFHICTINKHRPSITSTKLTVSRTHKLDHPDVVGKRKGDAHHHFVRNHVQMDEGMKLEEMEAMESVKNVQ